MFNAPARIWNEIAETGPLRTTWAAAMFPLPDGMMAPAITAEHQRLTREIGNELVATAYLLVMPLLWEREAIARYVDRVGPQGSLPPMETVDDAMFVANGDYRLTPDEQAMLRRELLVKPQWIEATPI
jgi:hypothetical protein